MVALRALVVFPLTVQGDSMEPTLGGGDVVLISRWSAGVGSFERGDLVVFGDPDGELSLKRVVGLSGDSVAIQDGVLVVDGTAPVEPYADPQLIDAAYFGPVVVGPSSVFVLGDNRATSIDSRDYGAVDLDHVAGRVVLRLWPPGTAG